MHNYEQKILQLLKEGKVPRNTYSDVVILHDEWCQFFKGTGECDCSPEITVLSTGPGQPV